MIFSNLFKSKKKEAEEKTPIPTPPSELILMQSDPRNETYIYVGSFDPAPISIWQDGTKYIRLGTNCFDEVLFVRCL
jgi:hypothetical protein